MMLMNGSRTNPVLVGQPFPFGELYGLAFWSGGNIFPFSVLAYQFDKTPRT
jgi:hypothetical protein